MPKYIDADRFERVLMALGEDILCDDCCIEVLNRLGNAPAADVRKVRHGMWIKMTGMMPPEFHGHYECSECEWRGKHDIEREYHYCPNCGAKMDGEVDDGKQQ